MKLTYGTAIACICVNEVPEAIELKIHYRTSNCQLLLLDKL